MKLRYDDAYTDPDAARFLWKMMEESLDEPHTTISHTAMPTWDEHLAFLDARTQRVLLLIRDGTAVADYSDAVLTVGFVSLTNNNEIGIRIRKGCRGLRYGQQAVEHVLERYRPLPGLPSVRPGTFIANINPVNTASIAMFTKLGAVHIQNTYRLPNL